MRRKHLLSLVYVIGMWLLLATPTAAGQGISIVTPTDGTVVEPGQTLTVTVEPTPGTSVPFVGIVIPEILIDFQDSPPFVFTPPIPPDAPLGFHPLKATSRVDTGVIVEASITLQIETVTPVTSIRVRPDEIGFVNSRQRQLRAKGTFTDGQIRSVTKSGEITYVSSNPQVASVSADGFVEAMENGSAIITISYKDQSVAVPVTVNSPPKERLDFTCLQLQRIVNRNPNTPLADKVEDARAKCQTAVDELIKTPPDNQAAVGNMEGAVGDLQVAVDIPLLDPTEGNKHMDQLAGTARQLAAEALDQAIARGGDSVMIAAAQQALADGDAFRELGAFKDAVNKYKDALVNAEMA